MADIFDVIADPTRRDILQVLLERESAAQIPDREVSATELAEVLGIARPTVVRHLGILREAGLAAVREEGQQRFFFLIAGPLEQLEDWLVPFLSADLLSGAGFEVGSIEQADAAATDDASAVFSAWSGADVGATFGRALADRSYRARSALHDASEQVARRLPESLKRRRSTKP
jgi:DNA-binding transcriptional ArsR family regulator